MTATTSVQTTNPPVSTKTTIIAPKPIHLAEKKTASAAAWAFTTPPISPPNRPATPNFLSAQTTTTLLAITSNAGTTVQPTPTETKNEEQIGTY